MRTIAIINQKGGCGKTTTAINLAGVCASLGHRTLLVDMDPQSHCAAGLAVPEQRIDQQIGDALLAGEDQPIDQSRLLWRVGRNLDLAPSSMKLAGVESAKGGIAGQPRAEYRLRRVLERLADDHTVCLIDCSPSIGLLTYNALVAADEVLIPVETSFFALQGAVKQVKTVQAVARRLNLTIKHHVVPTLHDPESYLSVDLLERLRREFGDATAPVAIRFDQNLREAATFGQPVVEYAPDSHAARDYRLLAKWLLDRLGLHPSGDIEPEPEAISLGDQQTHEPPVIHVDANAARGTLDAGRGAAGGPPPGDEMIRLPDAPSAASPDDTPRTAPADAVTGRIEDLARRAEALRSTLLRSAPAESADAPPPPPPADATDERLYGVRVTRQGVLFVQPEAIGRQVCIAGDFNGWSPAATPMRLSRSLNVFEACVNIPPGVHQYRLVIDGAWQADRYNPARQVNPFGGYNSVIEVGPRPSDAGTPEPTTRSHHGIYIAPG